MPLDTANLNSAAAAIGSEDTTAQEAYKRCFGDFQYFSKLAVPLTIRFDWPPEYIAIFVMLAQAIVERDRELMGLTIRFALGLPRGFAKTTFIKVLVCWLIIYAELSFILVVCATEPLSENFLADVNDILASPNMEKIFGAWTANLATDNASVKKCMYRQRQVILAAIGAGSSVRGLNMGNERPDVILLDDAQTKENSQSDTESARFVEWFAGTLLKARSPFFAIIIYIGNMYPQNCLLEKLQKNSHWKSLITGCILADGKSLWPELRPLQSLYDDFCHDEELGLAYIWFAEMMNQPLMEMVSLLPNGTIPLCPITEDQLIPDAGFIIIDPSGFKKGADDNVIGGFHISKNVPYLRRLIAGPLDPKAVIHQTIQMALDLSIRVIFIESVAYQQTLKFWFDNELRLAGMQNHFMLVEISPHNKAKEGRIRVSVQQLLAKTWYIINMEARQRYTFQALAYKIGKPKNKDDILDVGAYVEEVRTPENWSIVYSMPLNAPAAVSARVIADNTPF